MNSMAQPQAPGMLPWLQQSCMQNVPHEQVNWALLAQQWIAAKQQQQPSQAPPSEPDVKPPDAGGVPTMPPFAPLPAMMQPQPPNYHGNIAARFKGPPAGTGANATPMGPGVARFTRANAPAIQNGLWRPIMPVHHISDSPSPNLLANMPPPPTTSSTTDGTNGGEGHKPKPLMDIDADWSGDPTNEYADWPPNAHVWPPPDERGAFNSPGDQFYAAYGAGPVHQQWYGPPPGFFGYEQRAANSPDLPALGFDQRKTLPLWIREGLEKMEREKQKKEQQEREKAEREKLLAERRRVSGKSRFESDSEDEDNEVQPETTDKNVEPASAVDSSSTTSVQGTRSPPVATRSPSPDVTPEELRQHCGMLLRRWMTELLLEASDAQIAKIAGDEHANALKKARPKMLAQSTALAAISSLGEESEHSDGDDDESDDDHDDDDDDDDMFKTPVPLAVVSKPKVQPRVSRFSAPVVDHSLTQSKQQQSLFAMPRTVNASASKQSGHTTHSTQSVAKVQSAKSGDANSHDGKRDGNELVDDAASVGKNNTKCDDSPEQQHSFTETNVVGGEESRTQRHNTSRRDRSSSPHHRRSSGRRHRGDSSRHHERTSTAASSRRSSRRSRSPRSRDRDRRDSRRRRSRSRS